MASSGVWEKVNLTITPTFDGVCGMLFFTILYNYISIIKNNIPHTPSKVGVMVWLTYSHTPDEAISGRLAKACDP